ncbi:MAG TPA: hypothetical protein VHE78_18745 [Gemmatimonadaceae bacterium]|nr:hypothetical protein [Gemmatimonadaceae bacterium]
MPLPELPAIESDRADWAVRVSDRPEGDGNGLLGEDSVDSQIKVRSVRLPDGVRLEFDDTGIFDITHEGATITWCPSGSARPDLARADLLGAVFSVALHLQGVLCLHGSGVTIGGRAIGFLARKGSGKSTLAMALSAAGAKLVTDDMLAVHPGPPPTVWPAAPTLHLLEDSADQLHGPEGRVKNPLRGKYKVANLPADRVEVRRTPLAAVYELLPRSSSAGERGVTRTRLADTAAVMTLLRHPKISESLARDVATLDRAAQIVRQVPVYQLAFAHEFSRLPQLVDQMMGWHSGENSLPDAT